ncbi:hypothetical protein [Planktothrix pseudagardhii]|uniref:hypothetical protein n=1 Tax=Planktothrix pseudagardhii TaxID=132604 RepID=UPI0020B25245|nr:hypothetical protein [Planktothrix pseudagardhii]
MSEPISLLTFRCLNLNFGRNVSHPVANFNDCTPEALQLDARMAAEVTEIMRRVITEELDAL